MHGPSVMRGERTSVHWSAGHKQLGVRGAVGVNAAGDEPHEAVDEAAAEPGPGVFGMAQSAVTGEADVALV